LSSSRHARFRDRTPEVGLRLCGEKSKSALLALGLLCLTGKLQAQEDPVLVSLEACSQGDPSLDVAAMLDLARAELGGGLVELQTPVPGELAIIQDCATGDLDLSRTGSTLPPQHVRLSDVPSQLRARVGALAFSEYALSPSEALKPESEEPAKPAQSPARRRLVLDPELLPKESAGAAAPPRTWTLGPEARLFVMLPSVALGGRSSFIRGRVEWSAFGLFQKHSHALGVVSVGVFGLGLAGVLAQHQARVKLALSLGAELGTTWGKGKAREGTTDYALRPYGALLAWISLTWAMGERTVGLLQLGVGYALGVEAQVQGESLATSGGPLTTIALTLGATR
jgi:hypothetical protein